MNTCICGHDETTHGTTEPGCNARCLCELCPDGTRNDCWCAGFRPAKAAAEASQ